MGRKGWLFTQGYKMRSVVFDLDGTLADTSVDLLAAANACFADLGHGAVLDGRDTLTAFHGGRAMLRAGFERLGIGFTEADITAQYPRLLSAYAEGIDTHTRLYPGAIAAVEVLLAQGYATAICTNKPEALAIELVRRLGITGSFRRADRGRYAGAAQARSGTLSGGGAPGRRCGDALDADR